MQLSNKHIAIAVAIIVLVLLGAKALDVFNKAYDAYMYGLPIVTNYGTFINYSVNKKSGQYKAPINTINNQHRVYTYKDTSIVTPNSDTPYSMAFLDLRQEPIVISVPEIKGRYYSVQLIDFETYGFGYVGTRTTGTKAGNYMIVHGKTTKMIPGGVDKVFTCGTPLSFMIYRTQLFGESDIDNVIKIQNGYKIQTLSEFNGKKKPAGIPPYFETINSSLVKENFFQYLDIALKYIPEDNYSTEMFKKLGEMGIGPRKKFKYSETNAVFKYIQNIAATRASADLDKYLQQQPKSNNWSILDVHTTKQEYAGNWKKRAAVTRGGIYANDMEEAVYPMARIDANGDTLTGADKYVIDFTEDSLPPVNAFWSLTMYDGKTQLLIKNPINRYLINSSMIPELKKTNGIIRIYIQNETPGKDLESNWLPAPQGDIYMVLRLYYPKKQALEGSWKPPFIIKVPSA